MQHAVRIPTQINYWREGLNYDIATRRRQVSNVGRKKRGTWICDLVGDGTVPTMQEWLGAREDNVEEPSVNRFRDRSTKFTIAIHLLQLNPNVTSFQVSETFLIRSSRLMEVVLSKNKLLLK